MIISSTYICAARGLDTLLPPEPDRLRQAAGVAKGIGIERLHIPILEESTMGPSRSKIAFLDGLIRALDEAAGKGIETRLAAPAQRILDQHLEPKDDVEMWLHGRGHVHVPA